MTVYIARFYEVIEGVFATQALAETIGLPAILETFGVEGTIDQFELITIENVQQLYPCHENQPNQQT